MKAAVLATATVRVRFFARYAELAGRAEGTLILRLPATVADVLDRARDEWPGAAAIPPAPLAAVNRRHSRLDAPVTDGDEVALLPPLAGG